MLAVALNLTRPEPSPFAFWELDPTISISKTKFVGMTWSGSDGPESSEGS